MIYHNETRFNEHFVGNVNTESTLITELVNENIKFRLGHNAYFIDGKIINDTNAYKPLFISKASFNDYNNYQDKKGK